MSIRVYAQLQPWAKGVDLFVVSEEDGRTHFARQVVFDKPVEGEIPSPTMRINSNAVQALMDELWRCGYRPSEGSGSAGALAATERHLEDMRTLVFNKE